MKQTIEVSTSYREQIQTFSHNANDLQGGLTLEIDDLRLRLTMEDARRIMEVLAGAFVVAASGE